MSDPMPEFTLKAKDMLALDTIDVYMYFCEHRGLTEQVEEVRKAREEFKQWQQRNLDAMKLPDHKHVPVNHDER